MADMYQRLPQELTGPGGDQKELRVKYVDNGDGTWSLATTPMGLAPGAATAAKQDTTNIKLDELISAIVGNPESPNNAFMEYDSGDSNLIYVGEAPAGTATSVAAWKITRLDLTGLLAVKFADGDGSFDNVWDNREDLDYL